MLFSHLLHDGVCQAGCSLDVHIPSQLPSLCRRQEINIINDSTLIQQEGSMLKDKNTNMILFVKIHEHIAF